MAESVDIVDRADSLMQRRRTFVATRSVPPAPLPLAEDDDLPVLTEVVSPEAAVAEPKTEHFDIRRSRCLPPRLPTPLANNLPTTCRFCWKPPCSVPAKSCVREFRRSWKAPCAISSHGASNCLCPWKNRAGQTNKTAANATRSRSNLTSRRNRLSARLQTRVRRPPSPRPIPTRPPGVDGTNA